MTTTHNPLCPDCGHHIHHPGSCQWTFGPSEWPCVCVPGQPGYDPRETALAAQPAPALDVERLRRIEAAARHMVIDHLEAPYLSHGTEDGCLPALRAALKGDPE